MSTEILSNKIIEYAKSLGFDNIGFAKVVPLTEVADKLEQWLNLGFHGNMSYMENHFEKRTNPAELVPGAKTIISLSYNYFNPEKPSDPEAPKVARYAYGRDYHKVVKKRLKDLFAYIQAEVGEVQGRYFVDSAPVMEREWATRAGLGWQGKNTLLITPSQGSFFFLAEIILDLDLTPSNAIKDHCGTCTRCIHACPTNAISEKGYLLDGSKCISYLTIELRDEIPEEFQGKMENWVFGCDICQDVCPWNRFSKKHNEPDFEPQEGLLQLSKNDWQDLSEESYQHLLARTPVNRTKFEGLKRNIAFASKIVKH